jgi:hypothetical protein
MTSILIALAALSGAAQQGAAAPPQLFGPPWTVLVGEWVGEGNGRPGAGGGASSFALDLERHALVRRSTSDYPAAEGRPAVHHEDLMVIYPGDAGAAARALFLDNEGHAIEYAAAWSAGGEVLTFVSEARPGAPRFRLTYRVMAGDRLAVDFEIAPPGSGTFAPYVSGVMRRAAGR